MSWLVWLNAKALFDINEKYRDNSQCGDVVDIDDVGEAFGRPAPADEE